MMCAYCTRTIHPDETLTATQIGDLCDLCRGRYERNEISLHEPMTHDEWVNEQGYDRDDPKRFSFRP